MDGPRLKTVNSWFEGTNRLHEYQVSKRTKTSTPSSHEILSTSFFFRCIPHPLRDLIGVLRSAIVHPRNVMGSATIGRRPRHVQNMPYFQRFTLVIFLWFYLHTYQFYWRSLKRENRGILHEHMRENWSPNWSPFWRFNYSVVCHWRRRAQKAVEKLWDLEITSEMCEHSEELSVRIKNATGNSSRHLVGNVSVVYTLLIYSIWIWA